jgi:microsomal dipeptidase-like Zn-dependent dipeptidase
VGGGSPTPDDPTRTSGATLTGGASRLASRAVDRVLHRVAQPPPYAIRPDVVALHRVMPVVDLVVGTALFRSAFVRRRRHGHVDLSRLQQAGVDLVGLTIATRFPDLSGRLSRPHFRALGVPEGALATDLELVEWFVRRIEDWAERAAGRLEIVRSAGRLRGFPRPDGRVAAFLGVQGGHVLAGDLRNVARLRGLGVRMLALAHVMDNDLVGSRTGVRRGGLTALGREVIGELERQQIVVDLAHMSEAGLRDALPLLSRPFLVSHTGLTSISGRPSRWRRYSAATRNLSDNEVRLVGEAGGVIGVTLASQLVGGPTVGHVVRTIARAAELAGPAQVAIGSDFDGALAMPVDVTGLPLVTQGLLDAGISRDDVAGILGANALRVLRQAWRMPATVASGAGESAAGREQRDGRGN